MPKSPDAFRTISEVAEWLGIQAHVLRFWESKFTQVKPIKRAGGRRYYRPADMLLLGGIKRLLHDDGLTIKGVQKVLREEGMSHVAALSAPLDDPSDAGTDTVDMVEPTAKKTAPKVQKNVVLPFEAPADKDLAEAEAPEARAPVDDPVDPLIADIRDLTDSGDPATPALTAKDIQAPAERTELSGETPSPPADADSEEGPTSLVQHDAKETSGATASADGSDDATESPASKSTLNFVRTAEPVAELPSFLRRPMTQAPAPSSDNTPVPERAETPATQQDDPAASHPDDSSTRLDDEKDATVASAQTDPAPAADPASDQGSGPAKPKPRVLALPAAKQEADFAAVPAALAGALSCRRITRETARDIGPLLNRLGLLRDSIVSDLSSATKD